MSNPKNETSIPGSENVDLNAIAASISNTFFAAYRAHNPGARITDTGYAQWASNPKNMQQVFNMDIPAKFNPVPGLNRVGLARDFLAKAMSGPFGEMAGGTVREDASSSKLASYFQALGDNLPFYNSHKGDYVPYIMGQAKAAYTSFNRGMIDGGNNSPEQHLFHSAFPTSDVINGAQQSLLSPYITQGMFSRYDAASDAVNDRNIFSQQDIHDLNDVIDNPEMQVPLGTLDAHGGFVPVSWTSPDFNEPVNGGRAGFLQEAMQKMANGTMGGGGNTLYPTSFTVAPNVPFINRSGGRFDIANINTLDRDKTLRDKQIADAQQEGMLPGPAPVRQQLSISAKSVANFAKYVEPVYQSLLAKQKELSANGQQLSASDYRTLVNAGNFNKAINEVMNTYFNGSSRENSDDPNFANQGGQDYRDIGAPVVGSLSNVQTTTVAYTQKVSRNEIIDPVSKRVLSGTSITTYPTEGADGSTFMKTEYQNTNGGIRARSNPIMQMRRVFDPNTGMVKQVYSVKGTNQGPSIHGAGDTLMSQRSDPTASSINPGQTRSKDFGTIDAAQTLRVNAHARTGGRGPIDNTPNMDELPPHDDLHSDERAETLPNGNRNIVETSAVQPIVDTFGSYGEQVRNEQINSDAIHNADPNDRVSFARAVRSDARDLTSSRGLLGLGVTGKRFKDKLYGNAVGELNTTTGETDVSVRKNGNTTISVDQVNKASDIAYDAITTAVGSPLPKNSTDAIATLTKRVEDTFYKRITELTDAFAKSGMDPNRAKAESEKVETVARSIVTNPLSRIANAIDPSGDNSGIAAKVHAQFVKGADNIQNLLNSDPVLAQKAQDNGWTAASMSKGTRQVLTSGENSYSFGNENGSYGGGGGGKNGMWNGAMGSIMYGAYIGKRMWGMTLGNEVSLSDNYSKYAQQYSRIASYGGPQDNSFSGGQEYRNGVSSEYFSRTANQVFGGFSSIGSLLSGSGDTPGRLIATGEGALGAGMGASLGGFELSQMGAGMAASGAAEAGAGLVSAGGALTAAAPWIAGAVVAGGLAFEGANAIHNALGYQTDSWTPQNALAGTSAFVNRFIATQSALMKRPYYDQGKPISEDEITANMSPEGRALDRSGLSESQNAKEVRSTNLALAGSLNLDPSQTLIATSFLKTRNPLSGGKDAENDAVLFGANASRLLQDPNTLAQKSSDYASNLGFNIGTSGFLSASQNYENSANQTVMAQYDFESSRVAQMGSNLDQMLPQGSGKIGTQMVSKLKLTPGQVGSTSSIYSVLSANGQGGIGAMQFSGALSQQNNDYVSGIVSKAGQVALAAGGDPGTIMANIASANLSNSQATLFSSVANGDLGAMSYAANQGQMSISNRLYDKSGNYAYETNGKMALETLSAQAANGLGSASRFGSFSGNGLASAVLGTSNQSVIDAFNLNGTRGLQQLSMNSSYQSSMASLGVQGAQIQASQNYLMGSGTASNPSAGSSWDIQNRQVALGISSTLADFSDQSKQIAISQKYAIAGENVQSARMDVSYAQQQWSLNSNQSQALQQRGWTKQDYGYQDTKRNEQYAWNMEDANLNIRMSSGLQRRQLIKERDRETISFNQDTSQIGTERDRQKTTWAIEDQRYEKQKQYNTDLHKLDEQSFNDNKQQRIDLYNLDLNTYNRKVDEYNQSTKLDAEALALSRTKQTEDIGFQKQSLGIQASQLSLQHDIETAMFNSKNTFGDVAGQLSEIAKYDPSFTLAAMTNFVKTVSAMDINKINALTKAITNVSSLGIAGVPYQ